MLLRFLKKTKMSANTAHNTTKSMMLYQPICST